MTRAELVERMARAMAERHSKITGGCFAPSDIPEQPDDCADGLCYCAKTARRDATAAFHDRMEAYWRSERGDPCRADTHAGIAAAVRRAAGGG
jgi:hypothetical protein